MRSSQATVKRAAQCHGIGLHSGVDVAMSLLPAPPDHGIRIRRTDTALETGEIPVDLAHVVNNRLSTADRQRPRRHRRDRRTFDGRTRRHGRR